jgi:hypothetical protein
MTERPILFSAPMVRAILEGRKSQTRRILKHGWATEDRIVSLPDGPNKGLRVLPFAVGDRLWVREACFAQSSRDGEGVAYPADRSWRIIDHTKEATEKWLDLLYYRRRNDDGFEGSTGKLVPPIHMPRWASRITLEVTEVKVERLQDISEDDAWAEGFKPFFDRENPEIVGKIAMSPLVGPREAFRKLWETIHGPGAWEANPWVVALTFRRVK